MPERTSIHLNALNIRLTGHEPSAAAALARDLPGALKQALATGPARNPETLADTVAAQVARQVQARLHEAEG